MTQRAAVVGQLTELFRQGGFAGVSIGDIARATGLGKSSLYHHFPSGKDEMVAAVLTHVGDWVGQHLLAPLAAEVPRAERFGPMLANVRVLYDGGRLACVFESLSLGCGPGLRGQLAGMAIAWAEAMAAALEATGTPPAAARTAARDALIRIQGALVLARVLADPEVFETTLAQVGRDLAAA